MEVLKITRKNKKYLPLSCEPEKIENLREEVEYIDGYSRFFKVLSDESRLKIIYALSREDELCVYDLSGIIGSTLQKTSYHLRLLAELGFCDYRKDGKVVYYSLKDERLSETLKHLVCQLNN